MITNTTEFLKSFNSNYSMLYDAKETAAEVIYYAASDFDRRCSDDPTFQEDVKSFVEFRKDVVSSDREAAAFVMTYGFDKRCSFIVEPDDPEPETVNEDKETYLKATKWYNKMMYDFDLPTFTVGTTDSVDTENWGVTEMVNYLRRIKTMFMREGGHKNEVNRINRFIKKYA